MRHEAGKSDEDNVLVKVLRRTRATFGTLLLFSLCVNLLALTAPLYMLQLYGRVLGSYKVETLIMLTLMMAAAYMTLATLDGLRSGITVRLGAWLTRTMGPYYLESSIRARLGKGGSGARVFRDLDKVQAFIATQGMNALFDAPWTPIFIAIIWLLHPWLGIFALCSALLLLSLSVVNAVLTRGPLHRAEEKSDDATQIAGGAIYNAEPVSAMGMAPALIDRWSRLNAETEVELIQASRRGGIVGGFVKFFRSFLSSAILGLGGYLVIKGEVTPGTMIAGSIMLGRALSPVDQAISTWKQFDSARSAYGRLKEHAAKYPLERRRLSMPAPKGGLEVENLYVYIGHRLIVDDVTFAAAPGEAVAVIGPSAAGKSTLCRAIVGTHEIDAGTVRLDGVDMGLWNRDELGPYIGFLPQEVGLFAGTVRENISRMRDAPDEKVIEAAQLSHAHEMIARLPNGYETELGDGGAGLSGGQRQRLGLARAVFGVPPLIILDEPNANLDQAGEAALAESILELKKRGSTLLIVGHRPSTLAQADKVLLLADGEVQAFGPRNEVLEQMREAARVRTAGDGETPAAPTREHPGEAASGEATGGEAASGDTDGAANLRTWRLPSAG